MKIVDFGIAKSGTQIGEDTKDGQLKGKVPYMSPEQAGGRATIDWRSDIFADGRHALRAHDGQAALQGRERVRDAQAHLRQGVPAARAQVRPGYPPALERIVMKALAKKREDRYQSAREMQSDLEAFVREERIPVSQVSLTQVDAVALRGEARAAEGGAAGRQAARRRHRRAAADRLDVRGHRHELGTA